jgi:hypothetical protein
MLEKLFTLIIVLIIIYIWWMEFSHPECDSIWIDFVLDSAKTGDLILFKALDNYNSSKTFCYYTHIGVVYYPQSFKDENKPPMLFEAAGTTGMELYKHENSAGIFLEDLKTRLTRYKGRLYYKQLNACINPVPENQFMEFINYAMKNMYYEYSVITNGIKKGLGLEKCGHNTNCGELSFLSLIKLGILDSSKYQQNAFHHLYYISNLTDCDYGYYYGDIKKIKISPFV